MSTNKELLPSAKKNLEDDWISVSAPDIQKSHVWVSGSPYRGPEVDKSEDEEMLKLKDMGEFYGFVLKWIKKGLK